MRNDVRRFNDYDLFNDGGFFDEFFLTKPQGKILRTDIKEEDDKYLIEVEVPGYKKEDIKISLENNYLTINVSKVENKENEDKKTKYIHKERYVGSYSRSYYVGDVKQEDIKANFENGVLQISIPKESHVENKTKYISIN